MSTIILLIALCAAICLFASSTLHSTNDTYRNLLAHEVEAETFVPRLPVTFTRFARDFYQLVGETDAARIKATTTDIQAQRELVEKRLASIIAVLPSTRPEMDAIGAEFREVDKTAREVERLAAAGNATEARATLISKLDPAIDKLRDHSQAVNEALKQRVSVLQSTLIADTDRIIVIMITLCAVGLVLVGVPAWIIARWGIAAPAHHLAASMREVAGGRVDIDIAGEDRGDEIGDMARALRVFRDSTAEKNRLEAAGRAEREAEAARTARVNALIRSFEGRIGGISGEVAAAAGGLTRTAETMVDLAGETDRRSTAAAAAAEQTSGNVQTVASAAEEMGASIHEIGLQVERSNAVSGNAAEEARETAITVNALSEAVGKIDEVVKLIQSIAAQTNLLALNATIEAARAGEAGRGFAVVASEVKQLANQTAGATVEIAQQIAAIQSSTAGTVSAIGRIVSTIEEINHISTSIAGAIEEQNAATGEITRNMRQAATGTREVSDNIAEVNAETARTGDAASSVLNASGGLAAQADALKREVDAFLAGIRAA